MATIAIANATDGGLLTKMLTRAPTAFPGIVEAMALMAMAFGGMMGSVMIMDWATAGAVGGSAQMAVGQSIGFGAACAIGAGLSRAPLRHVFALRGFPSRVVPSMCLTVLALSLLLSEVGNLVRTWLPMPDAMEQMTRELFREPGSRFWTFVLLVLAAPVCEELLFRGVFLRGFLMRYRKGTAIALSALLFAIMHGNPWQFAASFSTGLLFAWWYIETRSILPGLLGHALFNAVILAISASPFEITGFTSPAPHQPIWLTMLGVGGVFLGVWWSRSLFFERRYATAKASREEVDTNVERPQSQDLQS